MTGVSHSPEYRQPQHEIRLSVESETRRSVYPCAVTHQFLLWYAIEYLSVFIDVFGFSFESSRLFPLFIPQLDALPCQFQLKLIALSVKFCRCFILSRGNMRRNFADINQHQINSHMKKYPTLRVDPCFPIFRAHGLTWVHEVTPLRPCGYRICGTCIKARTG
ncbi:uncharacterized protein BCR38DRAFT_230905 [Pseudomassariella vexata]|uniref:Uncharacterized protein n=1 Tax=Pseudomassariella vexata TaxID=1141098 RepID=A0A1Y2DWC3_9PEZI|nr:uncharacterized protein BCR38DRAFT_230905 [Pseudomassariella vexata]ORY63563.1 hypothetical protein BCR38DRAFT_230905 [Pseudomassariella vexata]